MSSPSAVIADKLAEPRQLALTANRDTVYMSGVLDLRNGPMVMDLPPGLLGTRPLVGSVHGAVANQDGSFDVYFGPAQPADVPESNWVQTTPNKGWFVYLWLYGPEQAYFDKTWIPGDADKVDGSN